MGSSYGQTQVAQASHVIVIATRTDVDAAYIGDYVKMMESQRGLPDGALDQYKAMMTGAVTSMDEQAIDIWATKQAYLALSTLLVACAVAKIDACPMEGFVASEYDEIFDLAEMNLHAAVVLPIGYRAADDKHQNYKKVRRELDDMVVKI